MVEVQEARRKLRIRKPRRPMFTRIGRLSVEEKAITLKSKIVKCAFCRGTGKDPWGLPSFLSSCQVCSGRGVVTVYEPVKECAFCGGTGKQPYTTSRLTCGACGGKGVVAAIEEPTMTCPTCGGSGINPKILPPLVTCSTCKGQGVIAQREGS